MARGAVVDARRNGWQSPQMERVRGYGQQGVAAMHGAGTAQHPLRHGEGLRDVLAKR